MPCRPLCDTFPEVAGGELAEATPDAVRNFSRWAEGRLSQLKKQANQHEDLYLKHEEIDYARRAGAANGKFAAHHTFQPG